MTDPTPEEIDAAAIAIHDAWRSLEGLPWENYPPEYHEHRKRQARAAIIAAAAVRSATAQESEEARKDFVTALRGGTIPIVKRIRHKKRGSTYEVVGEAEMQISNRFNGKGGYRDPLKEGDTLVVYRAEHDGKLWVRFPDEMNDGRFEDLP